MVEHLPTTLDILDSVTKTNKNKTTMRKAPTKSLHGITACTILESMLETMAWSWLHCYEASTLGYGIEKE